MARVTSGLWVSALIRRAQAAGAFATVMHKGNAEAGAVYVIANNLSGSSTLFGPALQGAYEVGDEDRQFETLLENASEYEVSEKVAQERRFDPDLWVIEIEDREGRSFLES